MISKKHFVKSYAYCFCDEPHLIENYDKAVNDNTQIWDCHHRLEIMPWSGKVVSSKYLMEQGLYLHQPPESLIFITHSEHAQMEKPKGRSLPTKGIKKGPLSEEHRRNLSASKQHRHWYNNGQEEKWCLECPPDFKPGRLSK